MKRCSKCGVEKDMTEFHRYRRARDGRRTECKACRAEYAATHYAANAEKIAARYAAYYVENREKLLAQMAAFRAANAEKIAARHAAYDKTDAGKARSRRHRAKRLAVYSEPYLDSQVHRDCNWTCHLCGMPVNPALEFPHPAAATTDHILPLSRGGTDTPGNVATAHWLCNRTKRDALELDDAKLLRAIAA